jgi:hypothetical protein
VRVDRPGGKRDRVRVRVRVVSPVIQATIAMVFAQGSGVLLGWYLRGLRETTLERARAYASIPQRVVREKPPGWPMRGACSCEWQDGPARNEKTIVAHDPGCPIHGEGVGPS